MVVPDEVCSLPIMHINDREEIVVSPTEIENLEAGLRTAVQLPPPAADSLLEPVSGDGGSILQDFAVLRLRQQRDAYKNANNTLQKQLDASEKKEKYLQEQLDALEKKYLQEQLDASEKKYLQEQLDASEKKYLQEQLDASEKKNELLERKLSASQGENCKSCGQTLGAAPKGNKPLGQKLVASQKDLDMRQLLKEFRQTANGKGLDSALLKIVRDNFPDSFTALKPPIDRHGNKIHSFSGTVIHLAYKRTLQKEENVPPKETEIEGIDKKLSELEAAARSFVKRDMKWDESLCMGYYSWSLLAADVNYACHNVMTKELLDDMHKRASRGEYTYGDAKLGPTVQAAIHQMRLQNISYRNSTLPAARLKNG